jgi:hypothetical protein
MGWRSRFSESFRLKSDRQSLISFVIVESLSLTPEIMTPCVSRSELAGFATAERVSECVLEEISILPFRFTGSKYSLLYNFLLIKFHF